MSRFKPSTETAKDLVMKVLLWGPAGAGKTHFMLGAPDVALLDLEARARNFAQRQGEFSFLHAELPNLDDFRDAVKEIRDGKLACKTVAMDSGSALYLKYVVEHTKRSERGAYVTDWVTVNRRFAGALDFVFSMIGKNVIVSMHASDKLVRRGRDEFEKQGQHFVGDERFRFGFDYIFRIEPHGDPSRNAAQFHVEKTSSPALRRGEAVTGLTWTSLVELVTQHQPRSGASAPRPADIGNATSTPPATDTAISLEQMASANALLVRLNFADDRRNKWISQLTQGRTSSLRELSHDEGERLIQGLETTLGATKASA